MTDTTSAECTACCGTGLRRHPEGGMDICIECFGDGQQRPPCSLCRGLACVVADVVTNRLARLFGAPRTKRVVRKCPKCKGLGKGWPRSEGKDVTPRPRPIPKPRPKEPANEWRNSCDLPGWIPSDAELDGAVAKAIDLGIGVPGFSDAKNTPHRPSVARLAVDAIIPLILERWRASIAPRGAWTTERPKQPGLYFVRDPGARTFELAIVSAIVFWHPPGSKLHYRNAKTDERILDGAEWWSERIREPAP